LIAARLEERKKQWNNTNFLHLDPSEILEDKVIDSAVTGYLFKGKSSNASVIAVARTNKMQEQGRKLMGEDPALEEYYMERADALVLAGNRLPESRGHPMRVLGARLRLDDALQNQQVHVSVRVVCW
jgi:hypothetical protein